MMTDPLKPLGLSFFQLTAARPMLKRVEGCSLTLRKSWPRLPKGTSS